MLWVRNGNTKTFVTKFAGVELSFPSGKWTQIDPSAARVIFGLGGGRDDIVIRTNFGILPSDQLAKAQAWLENFTFADGDTPPKGA